MRENPEATVYLSRGIRRVNGWLEKFSAKVIFAIATVQEEWSVRGGIVEIGVHHGKLFILLLTLLSDSEKAIAIDIFENQNINVDNSGKGNFDIFCKNIRKYSKNYNNVLFIKDSSLEITHEDIIDKIGLVRLFSIDGGHTHECTYNDLLIASNSLSPNGVIILDDFFNAYWPGVASGASEFMRLHASDVVPFAVTPGKVFLSKPGIARRYRDALRRIFEVEYDKSVEIFSSQVDIYLISNNIKRRIRRTLHRICGAELVDALRSVLER